MNAERNSTEEENLRVTRSLTEASQDMADSTSDRGIPTLEFVKSDPIRALVLCKQARISFEKTTKEVDIELCQACFVAMDEFDHDHSKWREFVKHINESGLLGRKIKPDKSSNRKNTIVVRFVFGFRKSYDRAYKVARVLDFMRLETSDPEVVRSRIEEAGGIENLYQKAVETLPYLGRDRETKEKMRSAYANRDHKSLALLVGKRSTVFDELDSGENDENEPSDLESSATIPPIEEFMIEVTRKQFSKLISMDCGEQRRLIIETVGERDDGWKRFKLVRFGPVHRTIRSDSHDIDDGIPF
ncbi:hypothetical protein NKH95_10805 [Mesorhizobium sp. M0848]|uniref:hypothetical protein n=1 Tax=Mesorhizobium sp. M0848 TaxID=2957012 RepID=UPI0033386BEE